MSEKYFFSPSKASFYPLQLKSDYEAASAWPEDGVEVTEDVFLEFIASPNHKGEVRGADDYGMPAWVLPPEPTQAELAVMRLNRAQDEYGVATSKIDALQQQLDDEDFNETDTEESLALEKNEWTDYRKALRAYLKTDGNGDFPVSPV